MKKQALSLEDVKRTIAALEVYVSALDEEIAAQGPACEPVVKEEAEATRVLITKFAELYEASQESSIVH